MRSIAFGTGWPGFLIRFGLLLGLLVVAGCGPGQGKVSGRVLYDGKPLPGGRVTFFPADTTLNSVPAVLDEQGNYEAVLPGGEVKVTVDNRELEPRPVVPGGIPRGLPGGVAQKIAEAKRLEPAPKHTGTNPNAMQKIPGKYVPIPRKYYDVGTTTLQFTVQRGNQTKDIELTK